MAKAFVTSAQVIFIICGLFVMSASGQDLFFRTTNSNIEDIEGQAKITAVSRSADFDGEGINNDVAIIDAKQRKVHLLFFKAADTAPTAIGVIDIGARVPATFAITSLTPFTDARTGSTDIAIAVAGPTAGKVIIATNNGNGGFDDGLVIFDTTPAATFIADGDFNNDGAVDLALISAPQDSAGSAAILTNDGSNNFFAQASTTTGGDNPVSGLVADFNDDDHLDLVVLNQNASQPTVTVLAGSGAGLLSAPAIGVIVPDGSVAIAGGKLDINYLTQRGSRPVRRNTDFNADGLADIAVLARRSDSATASITLLFNDNRQPGRFIPQAPIILLDDVSGLPLTIPAENVQTALNIADFNADDFPDIVVSGAIVPAANAIPFRAALYLFGISSPTAARVARPIKFGYIKSAVDTTNLGALDPSEGNDAFVAAVPGEFAKLANGVPSVLHISSNGNLWVDQNLTSILQHAPIVTIKREDLNAPFPGGGRKQIVRQGEMSAIRVSAISPEGDRFSFRISVTNGGDAPPSFATVKNIGNGTADIIIDVPAAFPITGPKVFPIVIEAARICDTPCGRFSIPGRAFFTLIVNPNPNLPQVTISDASFRRPQLFINGLGFGASGANVTVNGQNVSAFINSQSDSLITLKGKRKKLGLRKGANQITVTAFGVASNTFVLTLR